MEPVGQPARGETGPGRSAAFKAGGAVLIKKAPDIRSSEVTNERLYVSRRDFMMAASGAVVGAMCLERTDDRLSAQTALTNVKSSPYSTSEPANPLEHIVGYNNFYEFGPEKDDPARYAGKMKVSPWTIKVEGQITTRETAYHLEDLLKPQTLEERIYRLRCVEGWSMVVPWIGFPLGDFIKRVAPSSKAKFVQFQTLYRPGEMPGQAEPLAEFPGFEQQPEHHHLSGNGPEGTLDWPYVEGLRLDEAMHPLTILAVGLYGRSLLNQNGAPLRLVVPWK